MIDEAKLREAIERTKDVIDHCEGLRIEKAAGQNVVRTMFHRDADIRVLIYAARDTAALRDHVEILKRERDEIREALQKTVELASELRAECDTLETALESQRQATEEAMRRAEEARRELTEMRDERQREQMCKVAQ